jgi:predicted phage tail protein
MLLVALVLGACLLAAPEAEATNYPSNLVTTSFNGPYGWNYSMGYRFQCTGAGVTVTELGCYVAGQHNRNVRLWSDTGTVLAEVNVANTAGWHFGTLSTPVPLQQGQYYVVSQIYLTVGVVEQNYSHAPWSDSNITFQAGRYSSSDGVHIFPTSAATTIIYGVADIGYQTVPPPTAPSSITVPPTDTDGNFTVSWGTATAQGGVTSYELQEDITSAFTTAQTVYQGMNLSYNVTGKQNGSYYYRVRAYNIGGPGPWRVGANPCVVTLLPAAPGSLIIPTSSITGNYSVSWIAVPTATAYELEESFNGGAWLQQYNGPGTNWAAVGVLDGNYNYRVRARNLAGPSPSWCYGSYATNPPNPAAPGDTVVVLRPPQAPGSLTVPFSDTDGIYVLNWTASPTSGVTYRLQEDTDPNFGNPLQVYLGTGTSFTIGSGAAPNNPRPNGTYYYRVRSENSAGPSGWTYGPNGCTVLLPPPPAPATLTVPANSSTGTYTVSWSASAGATQYELEESTNPSFSGSISVYLGTGTSHQVQNNPGMPPSGVTYYYRVRAYNTSGWSNWTVDATGCHVLVPVPADVSSLQIEELHPPAAVPVTNPDPDGQFTLNWVAVAGAQGYEVEEASNPTFAGSGSLGQTTQTTMDISRQDGTYYYRVRAYNTSGNSNNWTVATNNPVIVLRPPAPPATLTVPGTSSTGSYTVGWSMSSSASGYELQESSNGGGSWTPIYSGGSLTYAVTGRTGPPPSGTTYVYRVRATNASGNSNWTVGANGCFVLFTPPAPGSITVPGSSWTGDFQVSWASSPCDSYELQESTDGVAWGTPASTPPYSGTGYVYTGTAVFHAVTGKMVTPLVTTYYYRVRARNASGTSAWVTGGSPCNLVAPPTPSGLTCPATSSVGSWTVNWNVLAGSIGNENYILEESTDGGFNWSQAYNGPNTTHTVTGKPSPAGVFTYQYRVSASNLVGAGSPSGTVSCTMIAPVPSGSITVPGTSISGYYMVNWTSSSGATSYDLEESNNGGANWTPIFSGNATSYFVTARTNGTYWYRVAAANPVGSSAWTQSGNGCAVTLAAPPAPGNITVPASSSTGSYNITWPIAWGATGYELQEATDIAFGSPVTVYAGSNNGYTVVGKTNGTYYYRVRSTNPVGNSGYTTGMNGCQVQLLPPGMPGNFTVPFTSFSGVYKLTWTSGPGAMWYEIEEDDDSAFSSPTIAYLGGGGNCVIRGKTMGTYYYRIRSVNTVGVSGWENGSNPIMVAVVAPALGAFAGPCNPTATKESPGATNVPMLHIGVAAGDGGAVDVTELTLYGTGTGDETLGIAAVRLWHDVNGDGIVDGNDVELGTAQSFAVNDGSVTFTGFTLSLLAGDIRMILATCDIAAAAVQGEDYRLEWSANGDMKAQDSLATPLTPQGAAVQGGAKTIASMGAGDLQVFLGPQSPTASTVQPGTTDQVATQINLVASSIEGVDITSLRVWGVGSGDEQMDLALVTLVYDADGNGVNGLGDSTIGTGTYTSNNGTVTFTFSPVFNIPAGASAKFLVIYDFQGGIAGRWNYSAGLISGGDVVTMGVTSTMPVTVSGTPVLGEYVTIDTPPAPLASIDPKYSLGGCSGGAGGGEAPFWVIPFALLALALLGARRRETA